MDQDFWHNKWRNNEIGFHREDVHPYLKKYWSSLTLNNKDKVLVPCCGKSQDLHYIAEQSYEVIGVELSELACEAFFESQAVSREMLNDTGFQRWTSGSVSILCGDLYQLDRKTVGEISAIYDRAALIAMPADERQAYCDKLRDLMADRALQLLLITMEYPADEMQGPPFSVTATDVYDYFNDCDIELLEKTDILTGDAYFIERGLTQLVECAYKITG